jgi:hypothetical protein
MASAGLPPNKTTFLGAAATDVNLRLPVEWQVISILGDQDLSVGGLDRQTTLDKLSWGRACRTPSTQAQQANLGRRVTRFRNCAGTKSCRSLLSRPIRCNSAWQQGQTLLPMSTRTSTAAGAPAEHPRLPRRLPARASRRLGAPTSCAVSLYADDTNSAQSENKIGAVYFAMSDWLLGVIDQDAAPRCDKEKVIMDWVLFVSLQWIVLGSPTQPISQQIQSFSSEELCNKAADAIRNEINAPLPGQRAQTLGRVVCVLRKER